MTNEYVVDANILIYAYDRSETEKQIKARNVLDWLQAQKAGYLTTQVLGEFFWTTTRRIVKPLSRREAFAEVEKHLRAWRVLVVTPAIVFDAARAAAQYQLQYWDAQIWATAKLNQIPVVLSEDLQHGQRIEGVQFLNPLKGDFPGKD